MFKRAWYLIAGLWALACIIPDLANPTLKLFATGLAPFAIGWLLMQGLRFVVGPPAPPSDILPPAVPPNLQSAESGSPQSPPRPYLLRSR